MDDRTPAKTTSISPSDLATLIGGSAGPLLVDVRRAPAFAEDSRMIATAIRRQPETVGLWMAELPRQQPVVVYCVHGHEVGQNAAAALRQGGIDARYLEGGIEAWKAADLPTFRKSAVHDGSRSSRWVTRARPKIDRLACPWLIRRFIDPQAEIIYVPSESVLAEAEARQAEPFDIPGVPFSHVGDACSFDAFLRHFDLQAPGLDQLARIVRGADTSRLDLAPQSAGLYAISLGLSGIIDDDQALLAQGMILYDALYRWCRDLQDETHAWPPKAVPPKRMPPEAAS